MRLFLASMAVLCVPAISSDAQSLCGAWKPVEVVIRKGADLERHTTDVQPGLMVFTQNYYVGIAVRGFEPRVPLSAQPTVEERGRAFTEFTANAGTYRLRDSTFTVTPIVAKNPGTMAGESYTDRIRVVADTLWFISTSGHRQNKWVRIELSCAR